MDVLMLARVQFALTIGFHFLFPAMTLGLTFMVLFTETLYVLKREIVYRNITDFLVRWLGLVFVMGVATGLVMEFSFGANWSQFSRAVGDVFGPMLVAETLGAFFPESIFIGALVFGRDRLSPRLYWLVAGLVFLAGHLSAFWIVVANSWMQTPAGYVLEESGRIALTSFREAVLNPSGLVRFLHTVVAGWITGSVLVAGIAGYYVRKGLQGQSAKIMLKMSVIFFALSTILQLGIGHLHAIEVIDHQPEKGAALEGHFQTSAGVPLYALGYVDEKAQRTHGIYFPKALSFLYNFHYDSTIKGLNEFPKENWPPVNLVFQVYHVMVGVGVVLIVLGIMGGYLLWRGRLFQAKGYLLLLPFLIPLPHIASETGWMTAELGRQPWVIYGLMKTSEAASPVVSGENVMGSLIVFMVAYFILAWVFVKSLLKIVREGPQGEGETAMGPDEKE